jgi:hypothetical protein
MPYATDADLLLHRPNILQLGPTTWAPQHAEAARQLERTLATAWYRPAAQRRGVDAERQPFAPARLLHPGEQLTTLAIYKTLELAYDYLAKGTPEDGYRLLSTHYGERYAAELTALLEHGVDYDWDGSATASPGETMPTPARQLIRR